MVIEQAAEFFAVSESFFWKAVIILSGLLFVSLLMVAIIYPLLRKKRVATPVHVHQAITASLGKAIIPQYQRIAVALDFTQADQQLIAYALGQATATTELILIHVVESASARIWGNQTDDLETRKDSEKLEDYVQQLKQQGITARSMLGFRSRQKEIVRLVKEAKADLLVIGAHGHRGYKDWLYGETIDAVRHGLRIPVLIINV